MNVSTDALAHFTSATTNTSMGRVLELCRKDHADELAALFHSLLAANKRWSACASHEWLQVFQELSPSGRKTLVDIGCNKGYVSATFFGLWAPDLNFNPAVLGNMTAHGCGKCGACKDWLQPRSPDPAPEVTVLCVEPGAIPYAELVLLREKVFPSARAGIVWHLANVAMSGSSTAASHVRFPRCPPAAEGCGIGRFGAASARFDVTTTLSVDELLPMFNLTAIDVLKTDTEGHDAPTFFGALGTLLARRVAIYTFEYHRKGAWQQHSLHDVVSVFDGLGFVCYFDGTRGSEGSLARLTGCWVDSYEFKGWSNVVCVRRDHAMYPHFEMLSTRYRRYGGSYFVPG